MFLLINSLFAKGSLAISRPALISSWFFASSALHLPRCLRRVTSSNAVLYLVTARSGRSINDVNEMGKKSDIFLPIIQLFINKNRHKYLVTFFERFCPLIPFL